MFQEHRSTTTAGRSALVLLAVLSLLMSAFALAAPALAVPPTDDSAQHCPDKDNDNKVEADSDGDGTTTINGVVITSAGNTLTFNNAANAGSTATISWCAKGGNEFYGVGDTDANKNTGLQTSVVPAGGSVTVTFNAGKDVSYFIPYTVTLTPLTVVSPGVTVTPPTCDEDGSFTTTTIAGVTYNVPGDWEVGEEFTITTTLASGYVLAAGNTGSFTITVLAQLTGEQCEEEPETGDIKVIKRLCTDIGENNTCNGRENEFDGWEIDFEVFAGTDIEADPIGTITVTLDEGNGSQGQTTDDLGGILEAGETYTVCEVPVLRDPETDEEVDLIAIPRPDETTGGVNQSEHEDGPCIIVELNPGTNVVQFLDLVDEEEEEPEVGTITIIKDASPNAAQDFAFATSGEGLSGFTLDDDSDGTLPNSQLFQNLGAGEYSVTEGTVAGWTLTSITCNEGAEAEVDETNSRQVNITLDEGEDVTCTFLNTQNAQPQLGSITIIKNALPDAAQDFTYTVTGTGLSIFSLDDDADGTLPNSRTFSELAAGSYTVTEVPAGGWTVTSIICSAGGAADSTNSRQANITLVAGANVTCTFVNTQDVVVPPVLGSITIVKNALPDDAQDFAFTTTGAGLSSFSLDDDANATLSNQQNFTGLVAGTYSVTETATTGWTLTSITCSAGGTVDATDPRKANITIAGGANVTCAFVNTIVRSAELPSIPTVPVRQGTLTSTGVPNTATSLESAGIPPAGLLGLLMVVGAAVLVSGNVATARRRR